VRVRRLGVILAAAGLAAGCGDVNAALREVTEAHRLAADPRVEFARAADAANRAVMADTDAASLTCADEAETAKRAVNKDVDALRPMLHTLKYTEESRLSTSSPQNSPSTRPWIAASSISRSRTPT